MKVLQVCEAPDGEFGGDAARHVADLTRGLALRGYEVHTLPTPRLRQRRSGVGARLVGPAPRASVAGDPEPRGSVFGTLVRYMRHSGPFDVIHAHGSSAGAVVRAAALLSTAGVIYTPHGFIFESGAALGDGTYRAGRWSSIPRLLEQVLARFTSRIVCSSAIEYEILADELRIAEHRLVLLHPGISAAGIPHQSDLRATFGLSPEARLVGLVGRLSPHKGGDTALRALQAVRATRSDVHLVIIGSGPDEANLRALATSLGVDPAVHWLGYGALGDHRDDLDVLVCPNRHADVSYAPFEALYYGVPMVATLAGAPHELIIPDLNGFIVPPDDPDALALGIMTIVADDRTRARIGAAARKLRAYLELDRMLDELEEIYFGRLAGRRPLPAGLDGEAGRETNLNRATIG